MAADHFFQNEPNFQSSSEPGLVFLRCTICPSRILSTRFRLLAALNRWGATRTLPPDREKTG